MLTKIADGASQTAGDAAAPRARRPAQGSFFDEAVREEHVRSVRQDGYTVLRGVFERGSMNIYATYALLLKANGLVRPFEKRDGFNALYGDLLMESLLLHLRPLVEECTGLSLLPTYSFLRVYEAGAVLKRHTDRPSCEVSASLTIGRAADETWPLWVESDGRARACALEPGDLLVYRGREVPHWRERFGGRYWIQAFFHYVDADGPLAPYKYDGRPGVGRGDRPGEIDQQARR